MPISSADRRKISTAFVAIIQNNYQVGPSLAAIRNLARQYAGEDSTGSNAAMQADVILDLQRLISARINRKQTPALDYQISAVLDEYARPGFNRPGVSLAGSQSFGSAAGPARSASANPPPYSSGLAQDSASPEIQRWPASARSGVSEEIGNRRTALDVTGLHQPSDEAKALIVLYEANKKSFGEVAGRKCRILVQDPVGESAEQISQSWDALFVMAHITLEQRGDAGILLRFFNNNRSDYKVFTIAQLQQVIATHPLEAMAPANLSGNMDRMLWDYIREDIDKASVTSPVDPLSLYMICDGVDNDDPLSVLKDSIDAFKSKGQGSKQWGIQAIRVGDKEEGAETLAILDDSSELSRDQFDTTDFSKVKSLQSLQKMIMGGFNRKYDKQK